MQRKESEFAKMESSSSRNSELFWARDFQPVSHRLSLTTGPWVPGSPLPSDVQVQELGRDGHFSSSLWWRRKHTVQSETTNTSNRNNCRVQVSADWTLDSNVSLHQRQVVHTVTVQDVWKSHFLDSLHRLRPPEQMSGHSDRTLSAPRRNDASL